MNLLFLPTIKQFNVIHEDKKVVLVYNGERVCDMPWEAALDLSNALRVQARKAETVEKAEQIIYDQAILTRVGARFGLTSNLALLKEAVKEACWNTRLRKYIPRYRARGIDSGEIFGQAKLIQH